MEAYEEEKEKESEPQEPDLDHLLKEVREILDQKRDWQDGRSSSETLLPAVLPGRVFPPSANLPGEWEPNGRGDLDHLRPVYNVFILPADMRSITPQDLERFVPLKLTEEQEPAWLAHMQPLSGETPQRATMLGLASGDEQEHAAIKPAEKGKKKFHIKAGDITFYLVLVVIVSVVLFFMGNGGGPKSFAGFSVFTVLSSSMESEIPKGSLVVTKQVEPSELKIGDDITYLSNPTTTITHRIIGIVENYAGTGQRTFTTQGVMNREPDKQPVPAANVVGKVVYHNLAMGQAASFLKERWVILLVLVALVFGLCRTLKIALAKGETGTKKVKDPKSKKIRESHIK